MIVEAEDLPASFVVTVPSTTMVDGVLEAVEPLGPVDRVAITPSSGCEQEVEELRAASDVVDTRVVRVSLESGVSKADAEAVADVLTDSPIATGARYVGPEETPAEMRQVLDEARVEFTDVGDAPTSFVFSVADPERGADAPAIEDLFDRLGSSSCMDRLGRDVLTPGDDLTLRSGVWTLRID